MVKYKMLKNSHHSLEIKQKIKERTKAFFDQHPESKYKISIALKKYHQLNPDAGKNRQSGTGIYKRESWMKTGKYIRTEQSRRNIGLSVKGRIDSQETREKKRQHMLTEWRKNPNRFMPSRKGIKATQETLLKLHYSHLGKCKPWKPAWKKTCVMCKKEFGFPSGIRKNQIFCNRICYNEYKHITAKGLWKKSYPKKFDVKLKNEIRYRDEYKCQLCEILEIELLRRLDVHHIDYNRKNIEKDNLIVLCRKCNFKVNYNRKYWKRYFQKLIKLKEVKKYGSIK